MYFYPSDNDHTGDGSCGESTSGVKEAANIRIMVGGGSMTQELADEMGADAYTETAVDAAEMAKRFFMSRES